MNKKVFSQRIKIELIIFVLFLILNPFEAFTQSEELNIQGNVYYIFLNSSGDKNSFSGYLIDVDVTINHPIGTKEEFQFIKSSNQKSEKFLTIPTQTSLKINYTWEVPFKSDDKLFSEKLIQVTSNQKEIFHYLIPNYQEIEDCYKSKNLSISIIRKALKVEGYQIMNIQSNIVDSDFKKKLLQFNRDNNIPIGQDPFHFIEYFKTDLSSFLAPKSGIIKLSFHN